MYDKTDQGLQKYLTDRALGLTHMTLSSSVQFNKMVQGKEQIIVDGQSLDIGSVFAVARCHVEPYLTDDQKVLACVNQSIDFLTQELKAGHTVYGVTTGFGGSANTRTADYETLQKALIQHHNSAVAFPYPGSQTPNRENTTLDDLKSHVMPASTVRAAMLTRCNSLLRGHSSVRVEVIENIIALLANDMTPVVPLRGSISASGDLTPLAYIAGALEGNPDILIQRPTANGYEKVPSNKALNEAGLKALTFGPKEGLGLLNGTAFSSGSASLVMFEANQLVLLSQALTAMGTEAMMGNRRNYHSFISEVRPHSGQSEAAANIFDHLEGSKLAIDEGPGGEAKLAQDRYAWRTAPQWIGPQLENMKLAAEQLQCELNSTTDNPLVDPPNEEIYHGGNFQAVSVTSAMEKTMSAMQMLGKMFFAQCSELINPMLSNGLPPNLCFDDPNISFAFKGVDINMAAYMSELAYLAHPVTNYVQSAEMHNQGLNSLAFIASRYAGDTVELLSLMTATYLYVICQALDLRALHLEFISTARPKVDEITRELINSESRGTSIEGSQKGVWDVLMDQWAQNSSKNLPERSSTTVASSLGQVLHFVGVNSLMDNPQQWMQQVDDILVGSYAGTVKQFLTETTTKQYLGTSSKILYEFVRETLAVPMHRGVIDHPTYDSGEQASEKKTIGSNIAQVYTALRGGKFMDVLLRCHAVAGN
ncbi:uncharacterized protein N7446_001634 [Penicillium canescens]|uniref:Phenylalanine ammonia-lyase n=1 Tax=Penicillium canescens TaxID=5083 RepID=A0AAD6N9Y6_PENCN|nr:uncharacterized protein N7446_001634 [Penicillium canescens]KAJ6043435.1 hypothetical protein N7460_004790 [Penicillium canescens]KAJ6054912.1 hypothetical protein N7444_004010 [Penicillium canescens]KAJ6073857.1 hypothetical protein N7446_001634 [Penicillium canescens]